MFTLNENYTNNVANKLLTVQNCREDIIGELDAIIQYENHYYATDDPTAKATILDIVNEEKMHVGQLQPDRISHILPMIYGIPHYVEHPPKGDNP